MMSNNNDSISFYGSVDAPRCKGTVDAVSSVPFHLHASSQIYANFFHVSAVCLLKVLATLCQGLLDKNGHALVDSSALPWRAAEHPSAIKLLANDFGKEVEQGTMVSGFILSGPRPKAWTIAHATQWLDDNPSTDVAEVSFIQYTITKHIAVAKRAAAEVPAIWGAGAGSGAVGNWVGKYPHLWLLPAIIDDDDIKTAYLARTNCPGGRMAVEIRDTPEVRVAYVSVMVAN
jgi:hypothetical protein